MSKIDEYNELCGKLYEMYDEELNLYKDSFGKTYEKRGLSAAMTLIEEAWNKLDNLTLNPDHVKVYDSNIELALLDLSHYCLMTYIEHQHAVGKYLEKALAYTD